MTRSNGASNDAANLIINLVKWVVKSGKIDLDASFTQPMDERGAIEHAVIFN